LSVPHIHHVNLQTIVAGGESYTRSLTRAMLESGARVTLYVQRANRYWDGFEGAEIVPVADEHELTGRLPQGRALVLVQSASAPSGSQRGISSSVSRTCRCSTGRPAGSRTARSS
jgi:hypothetical protein